MIQGIGEEEDASFRRNESEILFAVSMDEEPGPSRLQEESSDAQTTSSQSSQFSVPEEEISIWLDEKEIQQQKREILNSSINSITDGRYSPVKSTLNAEWDDISQTQQRYYKRKAKEAISAALSVISPGQEEEIWSSLREETLGDTATVTRKHFDPKSSPIDTLITAYDQAESWQTKRQIMSLFANDFSHQELQEIGRAHV